jgi:hypothetical protein
MMWTFRRGDVIVWLQTSYDITTHEFVLLMTGSDRSPNSERFRTIRRLRARVLEVERQLAEEHWTQIASPVMLPNDSQRPVIH